MWPLHFKHYCWWKRQSRSKFVWRTNWECECKMDVKSTWIPTRKPPLGGRRDRRFGDCGTLNAHNRYFIPFYHVWSPAWIRIHWNNIWLRAGHIWLQTTIDGPWPHHMMLEVCWDGMWTLRTTSHMSQELWPWNYESPKESVQRLSQGTSKTM